jgi:hypothetical protein
MRLAPIRRWLALLALPLLVAGAAPAQALLRCAMDGALHRHCCCPQGHAAKTPVPSPVAARAPSCCCSVTSDAPRVPAQSAPRASAALDAAPAATAVAVLMPKPAAANHQALPGRAARLPALGPPLILAKQSLLI